MALKSGPKMDLKMAPKNSPTKRFQKMNHKNGPKNWPTKLAQKNDLKVAIEKVSLIMLVVLWPYLRHLNGL